METKEIIKTSIDDFKVIYYDENGDMTELLNRDDLKEFVEKDRLYILMEATAGAFEVLVELLKMDLEDIWERLDKLEDKI